MIIISFFTSIVVSQGGSEDVAYSVPLLHHLTTPALG